MADLANSGALLGDDEEKKKLAESQPGAMSIGGSSGGVVGGQASQAAGAPVGAGGTGGWTNIQSYLGANQGDTGTAKNLEQKVGSQFQQDKSKLETESKSALDQSNEQTNKIKDAKENASGWLNQAAQAYDWGSKQTSNTDVNKLAEANKAQYTAPKQFNANLSNESSEYGDRLKEGGNFSTLLNDLYREKAGGALSSGQNALQQQFDVNNQSLADTRQNLLKQYSGLAEQRDKTLTDVNSTLGSNEQAFRANQNALKDYLSNQLNATSTNVGNLENSARSAYNNALNQTTNAPGWNRPASYQELINEANQERAGYMSRTPDSRYWYEQNVANPAATGGGSRASELRSWNSIINDFNNSQENTYKNQSATEKAKFNIIANLLGQQPAYDRGTFSVTGQGNQAL